MLEVKCWTKTLGAMDLAPASSKTQKRERRIARDLAVLMLAGVMLFVSAVPRIISPAITGRNNRNGDTLSPRIASFGAYVSTLGETGDIGLDNAHFYIPRGVAMNASGYLYVADANNHRVQVFNNAGNYQYTICGNGQGGGNNQFYNPRGVAVNATGQLFVADTSNHRVQVFRGVFTPTSLTISINGGAAETGSTSVTLTLSTTDATEMCFSNNGTTYTDWEPYSTSKSWALASGISSPRTVFFKARDYILEAAPISDSIIYISPPTGLFLVINGGETTTTSTSGTLLVWASGAVEMCFSNDGETWSSWEPFAPVKMWNLADQVGLKTVYLKTRNSTIESALATDTITYAIPVSGVDVPFIVGITIIAIMAGIAAGVVLMKYLERKHGGSRPDTLPRKETQLR